MRHLNLDPKEFAQESRVVMEERRLRTDDQPQSLLFEQMNAVALQAHPYRVPVIGWMNDLENMTVGDARDWYERWYVPNNAIVVVVGDVDHKEVFKLAEKYYGSLPPRALPARKPQDEPEQTGIRRLTVKAPAELPVMAWVPVIATLKRTDPTRWKCSRSRRARRGAFSKHLIREQRLAVAAGVGYATARSGMFYVQGSPSAGKMPLELEAGFRAELAGIQKDGVTAENAGWGTAVVGQIYKLDSCSGRPWNRQMEAVGISRSTGMIETAGGNRRAGAGGRAKIHVTMR
jgi:zinc protease